MNKDSALALLGLEPGASPREIKQAYLDLVQICHPDKHRGQSERVQAKAEKQFKEVGQAYELLKSSSGHTRTQRNSQAEQEQQQRQRRESARGREEQRQQQAERQASEHPSSALFSEEQSAFIKSWLDFALRESAKFWDQALPARGKLEIQHQHCVLTWVVSAVTVKDRRLSVDVVIDLATTHQQQVSPDPAFESFLREEDVREGLRELVEDVRTALARADGVSLSEMLQTYLLLPVTNWAGGLESVPTEDREAALVSASRIVSKVVIFSQTYPGVS